MTNFVISKLLKKNVSPCIKNSLLKLLKEYFLVNHV